MTAQKSERCRWIVIVVGLLTLVASNMAFSAARGRAQEMEPQAYLPFVSRMEPPTTVRVIVENHTTGVLLYQIVGQDDICMVFSNESIFYRHIDIGMHNWIGEVYPGCDGYSEFTRIEGQDLFTGYQVIHEFSCVDGVLSSDLH